GALSPIRVRGALQGGAYESKSDLDAWTAFIGCRLSGHAGRSKHQRRTDDFWRRWWRRKPDSHADEHRISFTASDQRIQRGTSGNAGLSRCADWPPDGMVVRQQYFEYAGQSGLLHG